jgi:hypothetical protein
MVLRPFQGLNPREHRGHFLDGSQRDNEDLSLGVYTALALAVDDDSEAV